MRLNIAKDHVQDQSIAFDRWAIEDFQVLCNQVLGIHRQGSFVENPATDNGKEIMLITIAVVFVQKIPGQYG